MGEALLTSDPAVVLRKKPISLAKPVANNDDDYEDIDAHLGSEVNESLRRSDYINWVFMEPEDHDGAPGRDEGASGRGPVHDRYAPSIKLHKHPALQKSQSNMDLSATEFVDGIRKTKPKNRAPPPPPGGRKEPAKDRSPVGRLSPSTSATSHKRSQSDLHLSAFPENPVESKAGRKASDQGRVLYKPPSSGQKSGMPQGPPPRKVGGAHPATNHHSSGRLSPSQWKSAGSGSDASCRSSPPEPVYTTPQVKGQSTQEKSHAYAPLKSDERFPSPSGHGDRGGIYSRTNSYDVDPANVKPKRQAPPPPMAMAKGRGTIAGPGEEPDPSRREIDHEYAVVNKRKRQERGGDQVGVAWVWSKCQYEWAVVGT